MEPLEAHVEVEKVTLSEAAYRQLRNDIIACRLAPGERLTERQLAEEMGFGLAPVRDALTRLDQEGLVLTVPRKGYKVTPLTMGSVENLFEVWMLIGPELFRQGVENISDVALDEVLRLRRSMFAQLDEHGNFDPVAAIEEANAFTVALAEATGNDYFVQIHNRIAGDMGRLWTLLLTHDSDAVKVMEGDGIDYEDLASRNSDAVAEGARKAIAQSRSRILALIAQWPAVNEAEIAPVPPLRESDA